MIRTSTSSEQRSGGVSLPVLPADHSARRPIKPSRNAPKRAIVLATIQILIIAHVVQWVLTGRTTTPIEPSEAMEFSRSGVINAGLIFFAIALLSTMLLGRWFCGWGCHVVMLQDFCGWMMKKIGIRPRAFRSRFLMYVPLIVALYMFIWPAFYRLAIAPWVGTAERLQPWQMQAHLVTENFWQTFPGVMVAIPFLLIVGFAAVYFLGSKGFCTYGCPYGGFFAPLDELSPGRIRVNDDCTQSGHCTARCTSNVRVHDEVREYGMVVDPGCMKCLDCVSVCPNNALYFGFGRPALRRGAPKQRQPKITYDLTMREEFAMSAVFLLSFLAWHGAYGVIPFLMAIGAAGVTTFIAWKLWRMWRDPHVNFHRARIKSSGRVTRKGWMFASFAGIVIALCAHSGIVRGAEAIGAQFDKRVTTPADLVFERREQFVGESERSAAQRGLMFFEIASAIGHGGIGFSAHRQPQLDARRAWLHIVLGEDEQAQRLMRNVLLNAPEAPAMISSFAQWSTQRGSVSEARALLRERLERFPNDAHAHAWRGLLALEAGDAAAGVASLRVAHEMEPAHAGIMHMLAMALRAQGHVAEAEALEAEAKAPAGRMTQPAPGPQDSPLRR